MASKIKANIRRSYCPSSGSTISLLRAGRDNDVWVVSDKNGQKIMAVRVSKRDIKKDIVFEIKWLGELRNYSLPVPKVIKTRSGSDFWIDNEGQVYVGFEYIEGTGLQVTPQNKPGLDLVKKAAGVLARIHNVSLDIRINLTRRRNILTEFNRALAIRDKFVQFSNGGKEFVQELEFYKGWVTRHMNNNYLVHNDYRPGNVLFRNDNQVVAVVDFDWSCMGPAIKDVAHALVEWSFPDGARSHWPNIFDAFLKSYNQKAKEKIQLNNNLYHWMSFACLSDTATYFTDLTYQNIFKPITSSYMYQKFLYWKIQNHYPKL